MKRVFNIRRFLLFLAAGIILYIILGAVLPFLLQPKMKEKTEEKILQRKFQSDGPGVERVRILEDNEEALKERIRLISQAKERIILSTFEFRADESGKDMLAALIAAAQRGVSVQVLTDGMPAAIRMTGNEYFYALSAMENTQIRIYNPITLLKPWKLMGRMHDKYLIADDEAYILGGRNTYDYFLGENRGYINYDWDVLVYQETAGKGNSLNQLLEYFDTVWNQSVCQSFHDDSRELGKKAVQQASKELGDRYRKLQVEHPDWFEECDYQSETKLANRIELITNPVHCYAKEPIVYNTMTHLMEQAKEEVRFHTPYIICNDWMLERLESVCEKVPNVFMMTNSVANNGNPFGAMDYKKNKDEILKTGVKILEYDGGVSYHGKCFVIDDRLSGIGSFNWDMRSTYIDTEMMVIIDSREVNEELRNKMAQYEKQALLVADKDSYVLSDEVKPQTVSRKQKIRIAVLNLMAGWARFLM